MPSYIHSISQALPLKSVSNAQLGELHIDWDMDAIFHKTGVAHRYISDNESAYSLACDAVDKLFQNNVNSLIDIDGIIFCTQSPEFKLPQNSHLIHKYLKLKNNIMCFDLNLACSGYIYGLAIIDALISNGQLRNVLFINSDTYSKYIHENNRSLATLFGDGASASIIKYDSEIEGFFGFTLGSSGQYYDRFIIPKIKLSNPKLEYRDKFGSLNFENKIEMDGIAVWSFINSEVPKQINEYLNLLGKSLAEIDFFIFHQASKLTLDGLEKTLQIPNNKIINNLELYGNTVSASIPMALQKLLTTNPARIKHGDTILLSGFGVGISFGTTMFKIERPCYVCE